MKRLNLEDRLVSIIAESNSVRNASRDIVKFIQNNYRRRKHNRSTRGGFFIISNGILAQSLKCNDKNL